MGVKSRGKERRFFADSTAKCCIFAKKFEILRVGNFIVAKY